MIYDMCHVWHKPTHKCNSMVWMNWSGNSFLLTIRLRIKRPCSRILKLITAIVFRINVLFILCSVLDVTNANLFEHYLNVLFMNLTINYIYSPSVVLSVEWRGPVLTIKAWVLSSIYHYSHQWSISHNCHTAYLSIDIYSFVFQIPYLIPAINHQQLIGAWLIIQLSHACLAWTSPGDLSTGKKESERQCLVSVDNLPPRLRSKQCCTPHIPRLSLSPLTPGVRRTRGVMRWWSRTLPASELRHPVLVRATRLSHASSVSPRVMRETRPGPGDAAPCLVPELLRVNFTGKSRAWCETGADAPFTSAAAPGSGHI